MFTSAMGLEHLHPLNLKIKSSSQNDVYDATATSHEALLPKIRLRPSVNTVHLL